MKKKKDIHKLKEGFDAAFIRRDHMTVILEKIQDDFRAFGEDLQGVKTNQRIADRKLDTIFEEVGSMKVELVLLTKRVERLEERMREIAHDTSSIKKDIALIKERLTVKIDRSEFIALEKRVSSIELKIQK